MSGPRLTLARLLQLAADLPDRYTAPIRHLARARALTGWQLDRLLGEPRTSAETTSRVRRRIMSRLGELGLAATMDRTVGGARAGSAGYVHVLTPAGHKFAAILHGRQPAGRVRHSRRPGPMFVAHALDIAEIYVQLVERSGLGGVSVVTYVTEPDCWWPNTYGPPLRPDAYTVLALQRHRDCWWLEIDRDTESVPRLRDKCRDYLDHADAGGSGPDGALPRVLFTAPTAKRAAVIAEVIASYARPATELLSVVLHVDAARYMFAAVREP